MALVHEPRNIKAPGVGNGLTRILRSVMKAVIGPQMLVITTVLVAECERKY